MTALGRALWKLPPPTPQHPPPHPAEGFIPTALNHLRDETPQWGLIQGLLTQEAVSQKKERDH